MCECVSRTILVSVLAMSVTQLATALAATYPKRVHCIELALPSMYILSRAHRASLRSWCSREAMDWCPLLASNLPQTCWKFHVFTSFVLFQQPAMPWTSLHEGLKSYTGKMEIREDFKFQDGFM